jgi:hypothetical protein
MPSVAARGTDLVVRFPPFGELRVGERPVRLERRLKLQRRCSRVRLSGIGRRLAARPGAGAEQGRCKYNHHSLHGALVV